MATLWSRGRRIRCLLDAIPVVRADDDGDHPFESVFR